MNANTKRSAPERPWATGVLVMSGAISLSFNTVHSVDHTRLAFPLALLFGAGPVTLAAMQSHVVAIQAARGELLGVWRKLATYGLVIGALALSFLGIYDLLQHAVTDPITSTPFNEPAVLTPIVVDLMAIAALTELLRPARQQTANLPPPVAPDASPEPADLVANSTPPSVANTAPLSVANNRQGQPPTVAAVAPPTVASDGSDSAPAARQQRPRSGAKPRRRNPRRSMTEWVELAGPIFHNEFKRLHRQPTASEFAEAIKAAGHGAVSASTAKNIRTEILDRAPLPTLD